MTHTIKMTAMINRIRTQWCGVLVLFIAVFPCVIVLSSCTRRASSEPVRTDQRQWAERTAIELVSKIRKDHPRIFLTQERIPELRRMALTSKKEYFEIIKRRVGGTQAALLYCMGQDNELGLTTLRERYGRMAADILMKEIRSNSRDVSLDALAMIYDWAYGALTEEERKAFVSFCRSRLGKLVVVHNGKSHGYRCSPSPQGILPLLAFHGDGIDDTYAREMLIQGIRDTLIDNLAMEHEAGTSGGFADGTSYFGQLGGTFYPFLALGIATNSDFFFEHEALVSVANHLIYAMPPFPIKRVGWKDSQRYYATFHDNFTLTTKEFGSIGNGLAIKFSIIAAEFGRHKDEKRAGLYTWFVNEAFGGIPYFGEDALNFVLMDLSLKARSPLAVGMPTAKALGWDYERGQIDRDRFGKKGGIGWVSMRSAWDNPDATFAIFKAEPFYYHGHMHRDSLAFMIAKGEELALARAGNYMVWYEGGPLKSSDPGWPQMGNFFSRTISTNNLLVYNPEEKSDGWANDGGQRLASYWDDIWGRGYNGTADGNYRDIGGLIRFEQTKDYVYAAADATRAYNSTMVTSGNNRAKVKLVQREFVYLTSPGGDQDCFVILDRVDAVKPEFKKFWLLQLRAKPEFDGNHRVVVGNEAGGIHLSEDASSVKVSQERADLFCNILLPKKENRIVRRLGGWITTGLRQSLRANENGPLNIEVESTQGLPDHPTVTITAEEPDPKWEVFDRFSVWPLMLHADTRPVGKRVAYFCDGKTYPGQRPAKLLNCIRATKSAPGFDMPIGAKVIQEFRHMGIEGADRDRDSERINFPWGYGLGYNYGDSNQYGLWRIEVSPKKISSYDVFFNVLRPSLKKGGGLRVDLIEGESGNVYGAYLQNRAVLFSKSPDTLVKGSYRISGAGRISQLLCNMTPGKNYQIKQDGERIMTTKASKQGTIQFDSQVTKDSRFEFAVAE